MKAIDREVDKGITEIVSALFDPIIVMPGGWGESLPEWLKKRVTLERLAENMLGTTEGSEPTATDAEAACYLYTASLSAPIGSDWAQIYLYVAGGEMKNESENELPEDIRVDSLTEQQRRDLRQLKSWIYKARVKHRREKASGGRRERQTEDDKDTELETTPTQAAFF